MSNDIEHISFWNTIEEKEERVFIIQTDENQIKDFDKALKKEAEKYTNINPI
jgi:hypothetical protein